MKEKEKLDLIPKEIIGAAKFPDSALSAVNKVS